MLKTNPRLLIMLNLPAGLFGGVLASFFILGSSVVAQPHPNRHSENDESGHSSNDQCAGIPFGR